MHAHLAKCERIWPNVAHLVKCRAFCQLVRCTAHLPNCAVHLSKCADWSNAPYSNTTMYSQTFFPSAIRLWNSLPTELCQFSRSKRNKRIYINWRHIHWPSIGKGQNKGSVLLWYSCFDCSILMCLMREGLQCHISNIETCLMSREMISISWLLFSLL